MLCSMQISTPKYPRKYSAPTSIPTAVLHLGRAPRMLCWTHWYRLTVISEISNSTSIYPSYRNKSDDTLGDCLKDLTLEAPSEVHSFKINVKLKDRDKQIILLPHNLLEGSQGFQSNNSSAILKNWFLFLLVPQSSFIMLGNISYVATNETSHFNVQWG